MREFAAAIHRAWKTVEPLVPTKGAAAVLWGHVMIETGGTSLWNFNLGNVKWSPGCGCDYHCLRGTWEGVSPSLAASLVAKGEAAYDTNGDHMRAVAPRVAVVFEPPHPATRFRAYASLADGIARHLRFLKGPEPPSSPGRYRRAWDAALAGDHSAFAELLHAGGYFTASAKAYADGMRGHVASYLGESAHEDALAEYLSILDAETRPELPAEPTILVDEDTLDARRDATTDAIVDMARQRINDRNDGVE